MLSSSFFCSIPKGEYMRTLALKKDHMSPGWATVLRRQRGCLSLNPDAMEQ
jgi:hypothetical protein